MKRATSLQPTATPQKITTQNKEAIDDRREHKTLPDQPPSTLQPELLMTHGRDPWYALVADVRVAAGEAEPQRRGPGRPKGSKNKPKA
jgi:hypothetical protein